MRAISILSDRASAAQGGETSRLRRRLAARGRGLSAEFVPDEQPGPMQPRFDRPFGQSHHGADFPGRKPFHVPEHKDHSVFFGQLMHGGWGYAEEYPISRYVVDAQVLPIFEGVKPILELKVIGRALLAGEA